MIQAYLYDTRGSTMYIQGCVFGKRNLVRSGRAIRRAYEPQSSWAIWGWYGNDDANFDHSTERAPPIPSRRVSTENQWRCIQPWPITLGVASIRREYKRPEFVRLNDSSTNETMFTVTLRNYSFYGCNHKECNAHIRTGNFIWMISSIFCIILDS